MPSAAADNMPRAAVERAIRHCDYSKINMSEFFFAEVAYYSMETRK